MRLFKLILISFLIVCGLAAIVIAAFMVNAVAGLFALGLSLLVSAVILGDVFRE